MESGSGGLLMASYLDCRPVLIFDTKLRSENDNHACKPISRIKTSSRPNDRTDIYVIGSTGKDAEMGSDWDGDQATLVNSDSDVDSDASIDSP